MVNEKFIKYPGIPYLESRLDILREPVHLLEKLDGGNCQVRKIDGRIISGSRSNFLEGEIVNKIWWFKDFVSWANKNEQFYNLDENFILFGEWLAEHNLSYDEDKKKQFYFFDMYDIEEESFLEYEKGLNFLKMMGIEVNTVDVLGKGLFCYGNLKSLCVNEDSDYRNGPREGLVIKDYKNQRFAKLLHPEFSEIREGKDLTLDKKYVTKTRLKKTLDRLQEEKNHFNLEDFVERTCEDIKKGHGVSVGMSKVYRRIRETGFGYKFNQSK